MNLSKHRRYIFTYLTLLKNNFVREAIYRANFITIAFVDLIWIGIEFSLFAVIYSNVPTLVGWTQPQVYFFLGIFFTVDALFTIFFQRNFWAFSDLVNHGELDILLIKPIHPLFLALGRTISITSILNLILGVGIMVKFASPAGFPGGLHWFLVLFWIFFGLVTALLLRFTFSIWVFWTDRSHSISRLYYQFFPFATKPDTLYPKAIRYLILSALPFAFFGSIPARALLHGLSPQEYIGLIGVLFFFIVIDIFLWRKGLLRYQSASS